jgi:hypothetical protein
MFQGRKWQFPLEVNSPRVSGHEWIEIAMTFCSAGKSDNHTPRAYFKSKAKQAGRVALGAVVG